MSDDSYDTGRQRLYVWYKAFKNHKIDCGWPRKITRSYICNAKPAAEKKDDLDKA